MCGGTRHEALWEGGWRKTVPWTTESDCHKAKWPCYEQLNRTCKSQKDQGPKNRIHLQKIEFHTNFSLPTCQPNKWGFKECLASFLEIGLFRPCSPFFFFLQYPQTCFCPHSERLKRLFAALPWKQSHKGFWQGSSFLERMKPQQWLKP